MGLDMYLTATRYIGGGWDHASDSDKKCFGDVLKVVGVPRSTAGTSATVGVQVGYWRKANAIHAWFVREVQGGRDECQKAYVERAQLQKLREVCQRVLAASAVFPGNVYAGTVYEGGKAPVRKYAKGAVVAEPSAAIDLLPTESGFFFGGTDYDEGYVQDLKDTVEIIDRCLAMPDCWEFEYQSSW